MSDDILRKWIRTFKHGNTNVQDELRGYLNITGNMVQKDHMKIQEKRFFMGLTII